MKVEYLKLNTINTGNHMTDFSPKKNNAVTEVSPKKILHFFATVEFGVLSKNCKNYGICRLNPTGGQAQKNKKKSACPCANHMTQIIYHNERQFKMVFQKSSINKSCREKYFASKYFRIDEDFMTTFQLKHTLGYKVLKISKGRYPIRMYDDIYAITFSDKTNVDRKILQCKTPVLIN